MICRQFWAATVLAVSLNSTAQPVISDPACPADLTSDNEVGPADITEFLAGNASGEDYNSDGEANAIDFFEFQTDYIGTQGVQHCVDPAAIAQAQSYWEEGLVLAWPGLQNSTIELDTPLGAHDVTVLGVSEDGEPVPFRLARVYYADPSSFDAGPGLAQLAAVHELELGIATGWLGVNEAPGLVWYFSITANGVTHHVIQPVSSLGPDAVLADLQASEVISTGVAIVGGPSLIMTADFPVSVMVPPWFIKWGPGALISIGITAGTYAYNVMACGRLMDRTYTQELEECQQALDDPGDQLVCIRCALDAYLLAIEDCKLFPMDRAIISQSIEGCSEVASN